LDRKTFYTYFEEQFFSSKSQDIMKQGLKLKESLACSEFINNLITPEGQLEMRQFLKTEAEIDEWETLIEFFVENGIIMLDVCGYSRYFRQDSLEQLEGIYKDLLNDMDSVMNAETCTIENVQWILEAQSIRLSNFLLGISQLT